MHEIGVVMEVVKTVEAFAKANGITKIEKLVLQIGELSSTIPQYVEACYPAAVDGTMLAGTELEIEILPGNALCLDCNKVFRLLENGNACPICKGRHWDVLSGKEFNIKEIVAC
jgi:Zn finger protein HypA/HybF (possibly regulating hydrogenase expression)